MTKIDS